MNKVKHVCVLCQRKVRINIDFRLEVVVPSYHLIEGISWGQICLCHFTTCNEFIRDAGYGFKGV